MTTQELIKELSTRRKGTMLRITYKTSPPLTAVAKRDNITVVKIVETTVRWGCAYGNLRSIKAKKAEQERLIASGEIPMKISRDPWWNWKAGQENIIKENVSSDMEYLTVQPITKGGNVRVSYFVNGHETNKTELLGMEIIQKSYWNSDPIDIYDIKIPNIISIKAKH